MLHGCFWRWRRVISLGMQETGNDQGHRFYPRGFRNT
jgi:hypothetical protein